MVENLERELARLSVEMGLVDENMARDILQYLESHQWSVSYQDYLCQSGRFSPEQISDYRHACASMRPVSVSVNPTAEAPRDVEPATKRFDRLLGNLLIQRELLKSDHLQSYWTSDLAETKRLSDALRKFDFVDVAALADCIETINDSYFVCQSCDYRGRAVHNQGRCSACGGAPYKDFVALESPRESRETSSPELTSRDDEFANWEESVEEESEFVDYTRLRSGVLAFASVVVGFLVPLSPHIASMRLFRYLGVIPLPVLFLLALLAPIYIYKVCARCIGADINYGTIVLVLIAQVLVGLPIGVGMAVALEGSDLHWPSSLLAHLTTNVTLWALVREDGSQRRLGILGALSLTMFASLGYLAFFGFLSILFWTLFQVI